MNRIYPRKKWPWMLCLMTHDFHFPGPIQVLTHPFLPKRLEEQRVLPQRQEPKGRRFLVLKGHDEGRLLRRLVTQKHKRGSREAGKPSGIIQRRSAMIVRNAWEWMRRMDDVGLRKSTPPQTAWGLWTRGCFFFIIFIFTSSCKMSQSNSSDITCHNLVETRGWIAGTRTIFSLRASAAQGINRTSRHPAKLTLSTLTNLSWGDENGVSEKLSIRHLPISSSTCHTKQTLYQPS